MPCHRVLQSSFYRFMTPVVWVLVEVRSGVFPGDALPGNSTSAATSLPPPSSLPFCPYFLLRAHHTLFPLLPLLLISLLSSLFLFLISLSLPHLPASSPYLIPSHSLLLPVSYFHLPIFAPPHFLPLTFSCLPHFHSLAFVSSLFLIFCSPSLLLSPTFSYYPSTLLSLPHLHSLSLVSSLSVFHIPFSIFAPLTHLPISSLPLFPTLTWWRKVREKGRS